MTSTAHKILVADGDALSRFGLAAMLIRETATATIVEAETFAEVRAVLARDPGIGLVAVNFPLSGLPSVQRLGQLRSELPQLRVVAMVFQPDRSIVLDSLVAGLHGCIAKDMPSREILQAFRYVLSGNVYVPPVVSELFAPIEATEPIEIRRLSPRQREVMEMLAAGAPNKEIARRLSICVGTVKVHVTAAFRALGARNRVGAAAVLQRRGGSRPLGESLVPRPANVERRRQLRDPRLLNGHCLPAPMIQRTDGA